MDTLDMGTNFMDYGNGGCSLDFSLGQAERMQFTISTSFPTLPLENRTDNMCESPCADALSVQIEAQEIYPIVGQPVDYLSAVTGEATHFEWYVTSFNPIWDEEPLDAVFSMDEDLDIIFELAGVYSLYLRAWDATDSTCLATTSLNVTVTCGVTARFSPDKREIASKQPHGLMTDSVTFINRSDGATTFEWTISHTNFEPGGTNLPDTTLTDETLTYYFREPGDYRIALVASDGGCDDLRGPFHLPVYDPTMDGSPVITGINCSGPEAARIEFTLFNHGYDTIRGNTPIAFYDANPMESASANWLGTIELPGIVYGFDSEDFSVTLEQDLAPLTEIYMAFNVTGEEELPLVFPPGDENLLSTETEFPRSGFSELTYENNIAGYTFDFESEFIDQVVVCEGELLEVNVDDLVQSDICWDSVAWNSGELVEIITGDIVIRPEDLEGQLDITLVSSSGVRLEGVIDVLISTPVISVDSVFRVTRGERIRINIIGQGDYTYEWSPATGVSDPTSNAPLVSPEENTLYTVRITDEFGCEEIKTIQVWVETRAFIPNLFTPNGDGANDRLLVYDLYQVGDIRFRMISKEGATVYETTNAGELSGGGWDGEKSGQAMPAGTYFWTVEGTYEDGRKVLLNGEESGVVHLVR